MYGKDGSKFRISLKLVSDNCIARNEDADAIIITSVMCAVIRDNFRDGYFNVGDVKSLSV